MVYGTTVDIDKTPTFTTITDPLQWLVGRLRKLTMAAQNWKCFHFGVWCGVRSHLNDITVDNYVYGAGRKSQWNHFYHCSKSSCTQIS